MSDLAQLLRPQLEALIRRWTTRIADGFVPEGLSEGALCDHIEDVLSELVDALDRGGLPETISFAYEHGRQRYQLGFPIDALAREYGVLRGLILDLVEEAQLALTLVDVRVLTDFIATAIAEGVAEFDRQRTSGVRSHGQAVRGPDGQPASVFGFFRDVTEPHERAIERAERLRATQQAWAEASRLHQHDLFSQAPVAIAILEGPRHVFSFANGAHRALVGGRDVYMTFVPRRGSGGQVEGYVDLIDDITERRRLSLERGVLRRQLEESQDWLRLVVEASGTGTWEMNLATHELVVGERLRALFGLSVDEPFDLAKALSLMHPDERGPVAQAVDDALAGRADGRYLVEHRVMREPELVWIETRGQAFFDADGKPTRFLGTSVEVTARKRHEQERERLLRREREARQQAEEASRLKDEFLSTVSHELRTPLTAVLGWVQILRGGNLPVERRAGALAIIERNARSQAQLIEDLLDMSRISAGKLALDVEALDVAQLVGAALESVRPAADAKGIRLQPVLDSGGIVMGDPNRLQQVVWNLLMNAVKFTPKGGRVQVLVLCLDSAVEITVADSGQGIAPGFLPHIFERFRQAESGNTRSRGGLGLGLSIVQQLVEMHGGTVDVTSEGEGKGASFTVRLPLSVTRRRERPRSPSLHPAEIALASPPRGELAGLRLLVVDDEKDTRELLIVLLEANGATVRQAASADEGRQRMAEEVPDVLVSDIGMPGENGHSFLESVRRLPPAQGGQVPAVALTAYARTEDRTRALKAGFSHHVAKPVETAELIAVIASLVRQPRPDVELSR